MVIHFPSTAVRSWQYQTTNGQYGEFYGSLVREVARNDDHHAACNRRVSQLSEELQEAKACLEMVNLGGTMANQWPYGPRGPCCFEANVRGKGCECGQKPPARKCSTALNSEVAWNCGQKPEPEFLEDHIKCYHPRLAKQLIPNITFGQPTRIPQQAGPRYVYQKNTGRNQCGLEQPRPQYSAPFPRATPRDFCNPGGRGPAGPPSAKLPVLPSTSRYNFYRYYGFAGQGAKTSKGYHPRV